MAEAKSHLTLSAGLAVAYAAFGSLALGVYPEQIFLAALLVMAASMLPEIDAGGSATPREAAGLLAAISPILVLEYFPALKSGGVTRISLIVIGCYLITRVLVVGALQRFTSHRGIAHSIPASILTFELAYLLFWDAFWIDRLFIAGGAFIGYLSHLLLDAYGNLDLINRAMGKAQKKPPVLTLGGNSWKSTLAIYLLVLLLGWLVLQDFYPGLRWANLRS